MVRLRQGLCPGLTADVVAVLRGNNISTDSACCASRAAGSVRRVPEQRGGCLRGAAVVHGYPSHGLLAVSAAPRPGRLDSLLDSGLYTGELTELAGGPATGKTQVCLSVAVTVACDLGQAVMLVMTGGAAGCLASRLLAMVQGKTPDSGASQVAALQRVQVARVFDAFALLDLLQDLRARLETQVPVTPGSGGADSSVLRLLVIDSVAAVISPVLTTERHDGLALLMHIGRELKSIAKEHALAVLVTNWVWREDGGRSMPSLGRAWSFLPNVRVLLEREGERLGGGVRAGGGGCHGVGREGGGTLVCRATLLKSSRQATGQSVSLSVGALGVLDS
ncbi:DNA repair protein RAD51 homolog 4 isoform X2 [Petromyzon marinus]|uniref:DNA repair protein RAD51 homolog 4 isoform X2 n=1 Tax=Petromyzon marinus TaxID=7757 RepID=A0AAJ7UJM0_PETMA|nr:DNA repair protein RAD51 homolog 4 isoform X2 [Petromyzon marinus]